MPCDTSHKIFITANTSMTDNKEQQPVPSGSASVASPSASSPAASGQQSQKRNSITDGGRVGSGLKINQTAFIHKLYR